MAMQVVTPGNLGNEFDLGTIEAGKVHIKLGAGLSRDVTTGVIRVDASAFDDVRVQSVVFDPLTNGLTLTETDGTPHTVNLGALAADKFLQGSSFDPATSVLTLTMTDGSTYTINLADLIVVTVGVGLTGDGTSTDPLRFDADSLPVTWNDTGDPAVFFVMSTPTDPDGALVNTSDVGNELWTHVIQPLAEVTAINTVTNLVNLDVQDAFGNHLYFALP